MKLRLMSNNQWRCDKNQPYWEERGLDCSAPVRERGFAAFYEETLPDVIGLQEVSARMLECLLRELKAKNLPYAAIWGRDTPILWRTDRLKEFGQRYGSHEILVGDLNTPYDSPPICAAAEEGFRHAHDEAVEFADETNGHHHLGPTVIKPYVPQPFREGIDHILVRGLPDGAVRRFERRMPEEYLLLSDHAPVWVDITL